MINALIILISIAAVFFALRSSILHFKGKSACCGGGAGETIAFEKTLENPIVAQKIVKIEGMTCKNCRARVQNSLNKIEGLCANVDLKKGEAVLSMSRIVDDGEIKNAVEKAGYKLI